MNLTFEGSKNYVASEELMRSVNIAIALQKPLLIKGEPGTGKTMLAEAISQALGKKLIIWNIKSPDFYGNPCSVIKFIISKHYCFLHITF